MQLYRLLYRGRLLYVGTLAECAEVRRVLNVAGSLAPLARYPAA